MSPAQTTKQRTFLRPSFGPLPPRPAAVMARKLERIREARRAALEPLDTWVIYNTVSAGWIGTYLDSPVALSEMKTIHRVGSTDHYYNPGERYRFAYERGFVAEVFCGRTPILAQTFNTVSSPMLNWACAASVGTTVEPSGYIAKAVFPAMLKAKGTRRAGLEERRKRDASPYLAPSLSLSLIFECYEPKNINFPSWLHSDESCPGFWLNLGGKYPSLSPLENRRYFRQDVDDNSRRQCWVQAQLSKAFTRGFRVLRWKEFESPGCTTSAPLAVAPAWVHWDTQYFENSRASFIGMFVDMALWSQKRYLSHPYSAAARLAPLQSNLATDMIDWAQMISAGTWAEAERLGPVTPLRPTVARVSNAGSVTGKVPRNRLAR
ncbi:hypothetical protein DFH06DRAFT_1379196 [Mycena polygramma]|nr:hypothetical protein DFH06DRAFT_1379196 [Mycena polygramma]